jgi:hypothetical protein
MWNAKKSVQLSLICTKIVVAGVLLVMILVLLACLHMGEALTYIVFGRYWEYVALFLPQSAVLIPAFYIACAFVLFALFRLHGLLSAIKAGEVFTQSNVRRLRAISWACFAVTLLLLLTDIIWVIRFGYPKPSLSAPLFFLAISITAAFMGLILRVVKNVFEAAVLLKDEVDFTI